MTPFYYLLSPKILSKNDKSYRSVEELNTVLKKENCNNIAITGTYGSGKSSILRTLESLSDAQKGAKFLNVSLSTLDTSINDIEYSIVQQLIYKADDDNLHQSRFCKIKHLDNKKWHRYSLMVLMLIVAIIIAFEPNWLQSKGIYEIYAKTLGEKLGYWVNVIFDSLSIGYILFCVYFTVKNLIKAFYNSRFNKFNIKECSVELSASASVFNKHLDEIMYFFQASDFNVVVFEDLDRFNDPRNLFLKLREINLLLNDSECFKKLKKKIRFIYAIRDDIFTGEERTKYFDYIVSSIPVVNTLNSGDYLINNYGSIFEKIEHKQFIELGGYIDGMRELQNIINEFIQYKNQVGEGLEDHKLFAMTIYKNKYPRDYSKLHLKSGVLYKSIESKKSFLEIANSNLKRQSDGLIETRASNKETIKKIRKIYTDYLSNKYGLGGVLIGGKRFDLKEIVESDALFDRFVNDDIEQYYVDEVVTEIAYSFKFRDIEMELNSDMGYAESTVEYNGNIRKLTSEIDEINHKTRSIERSSLSTIISQIENGENALKIICEKYCEEFGLREDEREQIDHKMCELILFLLRSEYIDEHYSLFISHFHPGSLRESDNDFLQSLKLGISKGYDYHLYDTEALFKRMQLEYFDKKEILNYDLLDGLIISKGCENNVDLDRLVESIKSQGQIDFIIGYESAGSQQKQFFAHLLSKWNNYIDVAFDINNIDQKDELLVIFYKYCLQPNAFKRNTEELSGSYGAIINNISRFNFNDLSKIITSLKIKFKGIVVRDNESALKLHEFILNNNFFEININNLIVVFGTDFASSAYTTIINSGNNNLIDYIEENIEQVVDLFPDTSNNESPEAIIKIVSNNTLSEQGKLTYIEKQKNIIDNLDNIDNQYEHVLFKTNHIKPTWDNILDSYLHSEKKLTAPLKEFIEIHHEVLSTEKVINRKEGNPAGGLFASLFANNELPIHIYKELVGQFNIHFDNWDLSSLDDERVIGLIQNNKIKYSEYNTSLIGENFSEQIFGEFLIKKFDEFLDDEDNDVEISNEVGVYILNSSLTLEQKIRFLNKLDAEIVEDEYAIAFSNEICFYYAEAGVKDDYNIDLIDMALDKANCWINKIRVVNSINSSLGYNKERVVEMLNKLGDEYAKLNIKRNRPRFDNNSENLTLISFLGKNNHVSSFEVQEHSINAVCNYQ